jgi:hypothetical protein
MISTPAAGFEVVSRCTVARSNEEARELVANGTYSTLYPMQEGNLREALALRDGIMKAYWGSKEVRDARMKSLSDRHARSVDDRVSFVVYDEVRLVRWKSH